MQYEYPFLINCKIFPAVPANEVKKIACGPSPDCGITGGVKIAQSCDVEVDGKIKLLPPCYYRESYF